MAIKGPIGQLASLDPSSTTTTPFGELSNAACAPRQATGASAAGPESRNLAGQPSADQPTNQVAGLIIIGQLNTWPIGQLALQGPLKGFGRYLELKMIRKTVLNRVKQA